MEDMIQFMNRFVCKIDSNESLVGFLKNKNINHDKFITSPREYFFITSLCSPMDEYIKINFPNIKPSLEAKKRMNIGNKIHLFAESWFKKIEGFESSESILDGIYFGLPVRGRIDARINNSIIELKTKDIIPTNKEELIEMYPQDIEQLGFYTCIDPLKPQINYLVFLSHENPSRLKVFKVNIKDFNRIKYVLKKRIDDFDKALKEKDPSNLGRCRYCGNQCKLHGEGNCEWFNLPKKECEILDYINIIEDQEFSEKIGEIMKSWDGFQGTLFSSNILVPRKYLRKHVLGIDDDFVEEADQVRDKNYIKELAFELKESFPPRQNEIPEPNFNEIFFSKHGWINLISSINKEGKTLPFIAYSSKDKRIEALDNPPLYKLAELGITVSNFNLSKGIIIVYYPKIGENKYKVFEVNYSFDDYCKNKIKEIIGILKSEDIGRIKELPECPWYFHKKDQPNSCC